MSYHIVRAFYAVRQHFSRAINGQGLVEYALILLLVSIVVISILILLGPQIGDVFSSVDGRLKKPDPTPTPCNAGGGGGSGSGRC